MAITLIYLSDKGVSFGDTLLLWGTGRQQTRAFLDVSFDVSDFVMDLSKDYNGDSSHNIIQRRDIYKNYQRQDNFFFLNFDSTERRIEMEILYGFEIKIENITLDFAKGIEETAALLDTISKDKTQLSEGEYFFKDLKLAIASHEARGGEGNELAYFYCSNDVSHLIEN